MCSIYNITIITNKFLQCEFWGMSRLILYLEGLSQPPASLLKSFKNCLILYIIQIQYRRIKNC